jgi:predicted permease
MKSFHRLRALFRKEELNQDLSDELAFHLEKQIEQNVAAGMSAEEARYAALRTFGGVEQVKEECRDAWGVRFIDTLLQDIRFAMRMLAKNPGFTTVVVLTLALGIGMNTAIFSLVDQLLLWTVPANEPDRLVKIEGYYSGSYPFFCAYRDLNQVFSGVLASSDNLSVGIRPAGALGTEVGHVEYVSGGYFQTLGIGSAAGRVIGPADDGAPGASPVAVLSYRYWQRRFSGDLRVLGQKLAVNTYPLVIIGVAQNGFGGLFNGNEPDAFLPITMFPVTTPSGATTWNRAQNSWLSVVARLKPGVSFQHARAAVPILWTQAVEKISDRGVNAIIERHMLQKNEARLGPAARAPTFIRNERFLDPIKVLAVATALVLLIACANVASLLLARASQRWRETTVRLAIGGTRARLIRQFLTESLLLAAVGSALGVTLAYWGIRVLARLEILEPDFRLRLSLFVLATCIGLCLLTSVSFGLVPALRATRIKLAESVKETGLGTQTVSRSRLSKFLVMNQVAFSLMLLVLASLFGRTLRNLQHIDLGFERENIAVFDIDPTSLGYQAQRLRSFYDQLLERARALRGVRSVGLSGMTPMTIYSMGISISSDPSKPNLFIFFNPVSSGYFATLGIPFLFGRDFRPEDEPEVVPGDGTMFSRSAAVGGRWVDISKICIMDEALARQQFGTANAVGRRFCYPDGSGGCAPGPEVVGVVKNVHYGEVTRPDPDGVLYEPEWSNGPGSRWMEIRFTGSSAPIISGVRHALEDLDPNVPLLRVRMMEEYVNSQLAHERLVAYLSSFFGVVALGLTAVGLYGVLAYAVTRRTREIGIRMAMGAQRSKVVGLILRELFAPVVAGVVIGLVVAFSWSLFLGSLLYGVDSFDPESALLAITVMLVVALVAAVIPAHRATKVDPMVALRHE